MGKAINTFDTSSLNNVFEIKIAWDGVAPTLCFHEIEFQRLRKSMKLIKKN